MHRENGASEFRARIARGLRSHNDGGHERIRRAEGGDIPDTSAKKPNDSPMKRGGRVKHREHHGWGDIIGQVAQIGLPLLASFLKEGGSVDAKRRGGHVRRKHHDDGGAASGSSEGGMRRGGRVHRSHHAGGGPLSSILGMFGLKDGGDVPRKAAGGVGKIRHGESKGRGYVD